MSETILHTRLVAVIVEWVRVQYSAKPGLSLFCDSPTVLLTEKPSPIEGFFPDVYAATTPCTFTLIGEAKTIPDLESARSFNQIVAFLQFLLPRPQPILVMAIPWQATATAKNIVALAKREANAEAVQTHFLTEHTAVC
jgi:hypothetical protein